ncbi:FkbM family methyltransferase [Runella defluvii]|uniref:FkbM family methyltransferase n=1 Tax=Runella defluvii TaxID=370973 RepID=A0A7W5ZGH5_9BACT|nr:FkbM family methyltransferase [Runella defluvii]MBB3836883.1 FkbM family methyltransferase [Runella defluvii]
MINNKLVYDVGLHLGYDTKLYLSKGYKVIAIEANPTLINLSTIQFNQSIKEGNLTLLNNAISNIDNATVPFYISQLGSAQSSLQKTMAERRGGILEIQIETKKLSSIFREHGTPYYCKIDIEGHDFIALETLSNSNLRPRFISAEINNVSDDGILVSDIVEIDKLYPIWFSILEKLNHLGYSKFKVVEQASLRVLSLQMLQRDVFFQNGSLISRIKNRLNRIWTCFNFKPALNKGYFSDCSGPFGESLEGEWVGFDEAKQIIISFGQQMHNRGINVLWCDIHATN